MHSLLQLSQFVGLAPANAAALIAMTTIYRINRGGVIRLRRPLPVAVALMCAVALFNLVPVETILLDGRLPEYLGTIAKVYTMSGPVGQVLQVLNVVAIAVTLPLLAWQLCRLVQLPPTSSHATHRPHPRAGHDA